MKRITKLLKYSSDDEFFNYISINLKDKITQWDYFVNWNTVQNNIHLVEIELNLLNFLIGKKNLKKEATQLIKKYPNVTKAIPLIIGIRHNSIDVLIDSKKFLYQNFNFEKQSFTDKECEDIADFLIKVGVGKLISNKTIKNLVDYAIGVEVGLDSHSRKNRGGKLMENLVEEFILEMCESNNMMYISQATANKIKDKWNIDIKIDKSSRIIDFAVLYKNKVFFIECNFYGGGGSKLKSTATEYIEMNRYWKEQGINFIWITDGAGWKSTLNPLREFFNKADYLLNLNLLKENSLTKIIKNA
jgi:type II restriction enzyme